MLRLCILLLSAVFVVTGCSRPSYINVPNDGSDANIDRSRFQYYDKSFLKQSGGNWFYKGER
ncbi:MAG: hypothetical protein ACPGYV_05605, partial [Phycisphaeraceae bacterium]